MLPKAILMDYTEEEAQRRTEATLRAAFNTPFKPQSEMKLGKPRGKPSKSPNVRKKAQPRAKGQ